MASNYNFGILFRLHFAFLSFCNFRWFFCSSPFDFRFAFSPYHLRMLGIFNIIMVSINVNWLQQFYVPENWNKVFCLEFLYFFLPANSIIYYGVGVYSIDTAKHVYEHSFEMKRYTLKIQMRTLHRYNFFLIIHASKSRCLPEKIWILDMREFTMVLMLYFTLNTCTRTKIASTNNKSNSIYLCVYNRRKGKCDSNQLFWREWKASYIFMFIIRCVC